MKRSNDNPDIIFDEIYNKYRRTAVEIAYGVLKDAELALDVCQSAFSYIAQNLGKVGSNQEKTRNYVLKVIRHFAIDEYRKERYRRSHEIPLADIEENDDGSGLSNYKMTDLSGESFESILLKKYEVIDLLEAMEDLSEKYRQYIEEYFFEELSMKQIADKYGINEDTAKKRVYRSIDKLRKLFLKKGWQENA